MAIIVYSKPNCVQCSATYRALDKAGLVYRTVDVALDVEALEHKNKISPYQGRTLRGVVKRTVLRGRTVDRDSKAGRMIRRP